MGLGVDRNSEVERKRELEWGWGGMWSRVELEE